LPFQANQDRNSAARLGGFFFHHADGLHATSVIRRYTTEREENRFDPWLMSAMAMFRQQ